MSSKIEIALNGIQNAQFDPDALNFLSTAGLTDTASLYAINNLVTGLKLKNLWNKTLGVYPFAGTTSATQKLNLKDPRDLDEAYRLTFNGGWTHSSTGATPNGVDAYANTHILGTTLSQNDFHISYYSRTNNTNGTATEIGAEVSGGVKIVLKTRAALSANQFEVFMNSTTSTAVTNTNASGFFVGNRTGSTTLNTWKNAQKLATASTASTTPPGFSIYLGASNVSGTAQSFSNRESGFVTIGQGLTDAEVENLTSIVVRFQQDLSRNYPAVVVGNSVIQYSPDGINWTTASFSGLDYRAVGYSPENYTWVAVGVSSVTNFNSSTGAGLWRIGTIPTANTWDRVIWASGMNLFVATAAVSSSASNAIATSTDGITFVSRTATSTNNWRELAYSPSLNRLVSVASNGTATTGVQTSDDGITWTTRTAPSGGAWWGVAWSANLSIFCAVKFGSTDIMTSPDGITWTARTGGNANQWIGIAWSPQLGLFAAVANSGTQNRVQTSPDGINWTVRSTPVEADIGWNAISWSDKLLMFIAVAAAGPSSQQIMTSKDGITWTMRNSTTNTLIGVGTF